MTPTRTSAETVARGALVPFTQDLKVRFYHPYASLKINLHSVITFHSKATVNSATAKSPHTESCEPNMNYDSVNSKLTQHEQIVI